MSETVTLKVPLDNPFRHPTMGKSCSSTPAVCFTDGDFALPKAIIVENEYISLEGAYHIHAFDKEGGFIEYTDGREVRLRGEMNATMLKKLLFLSALQPNKKPEPPQPPKRKRTFRFNPFWLVWFLATLAMVYFISIR